MNPNQAERGKKRGESIEYLVCKRGDKAGEPAKHSNDADTITSRDVFVGQSLNNVTRVSFHWPLQWRAGASELSLRVSAP